MMNQTTTVRERLGKWLQVGGFFNPAEMASANPDGTRQMVLDAIAALGYAEAQLAALTQEQARLQAKVETRERHIQQLIEDRGHKGVK